MTLHWMYDVLPISSIGGLWEVSSVFLSELHKCLQIKIQAIKNQNIFNWKGHIAVEFLEWSPLPLIGLQWTYLGVEHSRCMPLFQWVESAFVHFSLDDNATLLIKSGVILVGNEECCWKLGFPSEGGERAISYGGGQGWICKIHEKQFAWRSWKIERNLHGKSETLHNSFKGPCGCLTAEKGVRPYQSPPFRAVSPTLMRFCIIVCFMSHLYITRFFPSFRLLVQKEVCSNFYFIS